MASFLPRCVAGRRSWLQPLLVAVVAAAGLPAAARSIEIDDFTVDLRVEESSAFTVAETLRVRFDGDWNGIIRSIPIQYTTPSGEGRSFGFRLESVTDEAGNRLDTQKSRRGAYVDLKIRVPGAANAVRTVVIRYRITGGLRFFDDHDELYWNVTGDEWSFPIHAARARVMLPGNLVNVRVNAFTGSYGSQERLVRIRVDGVAQEPDDAIAPVSESPAPPAGEHVVEVEAARPLGIHEGLTVAVAWNPGLVQRPSPWGRVLTTWSSWLVGRSLVVAVLAAPALAFLGMFWRWWRVGRDPRSGPLVVAYEPPEGLGPAEVGTLVDNRPDNRDLIAGLVDAAIKGAVRIRETVPDGWLTRPQYAYDLLAPESEWVSLGISPAGCKMLCGMFGIASKPPSTVTSDDLEDSFYKILPQVKDAIYKDLLDRGFYRARPDTTITSYAVIAAIAGAAVWLLAIVVLPWTGSRDDFTTVVAPILLGAATMMIVVIFALFMPARTVAGAKARDQARGFEEFLSRVDKHRLETLPLSPQLFEKYLPYAIALGVERRWAKAFAKICTQPPTWYAGTSADSLFDTDRFTRQLGVMSTTTTSAMTSSPRSSGDSGFSGSSGGGYSGGGSGGGGGSGW